MAYLCAMPESLYFVYCMLAMVMIRLIGDVHHRFHSSHSVHSSAWHDCVISMWELATHIKYGASSIV